MNRRFSSSVQSSFTLAVAFLLLLLLLASTSPSVAAGKDSSGYIRSSLPHFQDENATISTTTHRKHLREIGMEHPNRIGGEKCTKADIVINQGPTEPLPSGVPTYTVEIINVCVTGCDIARIHLTCGWFSSARLINPKIFKRLRYNDCLVNNGKALANGGTLSFQYANTFPYPLSVSHVACY